MESGLSLAFECTEKKTRHFPTQVQTRSGDKGSGVELVSQSFKRIPLMVEYVMKLSI